MNNMKRTFEFKLVITASSDDGLDHIEDLKKMVLSGELQRSWVKDGKLDKVIATIKQLKDESK